MRSIVKYIKESKTIIFLRLLNECLHEGLIAAKHLSGSGQSKDPSKLRTPISITAHALEKGMSIGSVRPGFGKSKAIDILCLLKQYLNVNGDRDFVVEICSVIKKYIDYNVKLGADMSNIINKFTKFCFEYNIHYNEKGGGLYKTLDDTNNALSKAFDVFSQSRYSIRDFGSESISLDSIKDALKLAERTPSACNRQRWRVYIYNTPSIKDKLFELQGGASGFYKEMQVAILICADMRGYGSNELHQAYVDGGLYAMNLLYCLHYKGLATIPLTMGHKLHKTLRIKKEFGIPEYEIPVLLIGVGSYKHEYRVAVSERVTYDKYCSFI